MGRAKQLWMEQLEEEASEERAAWIREQLGDPEADEDSPGWQRLSNDYDMFGGHGRSYDDDWEVSGKSSLEIFKENIAASSELLTLRPSHRAKRSLLVMLHAHVVTAVEAYLSSTFIESALASDDLMRRLVETDPEFARRKFSLQEIFTKRDSLEDDVKRYLKDLIFHDIAKIKNMYLSVLGTDFGEVAWLFEAVALRHDCVHRAGYDKDGNEAPVSEESIETLIGSCSELVALVQTSIEKLPAPRKEFF
jgi:hypothetical protein